MNENHEQLEAELLRISDLNLEEQPAAFSALRDKLEEQLNSSDDKSAEH